MPVTLATLPIRMNSGMTISSGLEASVKDSEASSPMAAFSPFSDQTPMKPTRNIAKATGIRKASRTSRTEMPVRAMATGLIQGAPSDGATGQR